MKYKSEEVTLNSLKRDLSNAILNLTVEKKKDRDEEFREQYRLFVQWVSIQQREDENMYLFKLAKYGNLSALMKKIRILQNRSTATLTKYDYIPHNEEVINVYTTCYRRIYLTSLFK